MEQLEQSIEAFARSDWLATLIVAAVILVVTAVCARLARRFMRKILHLNEEKGLPSSSIFVNIVRASVWVVGVSIMLSSCYNVDVSAAVTALGIGGIAISLGFQDTISNLIGGLQVSLMRIVKPGDNIEVGTSKGVVKDVTWRHTSIRNAKGETIIIPNSIINKTALVHLPPTNQVSLPVMVSTDGARLNDVACAIEQVAERAASQVGKVSKKPKLSFSEITDGGFKGSLVFTMSDSRVGARAGDAALRAIAPLTRSTDALGSADAARAQDACEPSGDAAATERAGGVSNPAVKHADSEDGKTG